MIQSFDTNRLRLRPLAPEAPPDLAELKALLSPNVLTHLPPALQRVADPGGWLAERLAECAVLGVYDRKAGELLGLVLLADPEGDGRNLHLGYLLAERVWGQGFGSELLAALPAAAPGATLWGGVGRDNPASARVLEKAGFARCETRSTDDTDMFVRRPKALSI